MRYDRIVGLTADQEREFYDNVYAKFLNLNDDNLVCTRAVLLSSLADPSQPIYERRRLYGRIEEVLSSELANGASVLDYGCGTGDWGLMLAAEGATVTLLDLSPIAIELVARRAIAGGIDGSVRPIARDANDLSCFADGEFDLIFASAALHHTLKYSAALSELIRVLRPGGQLILAETYGNNRLLNWARKVHWWIAGQADDAGEGIVFNDEHIELLRTHLELVEVTPLNLMAMAKRLFRGHFTSPIVRFFIRLLECLDAVVLTRFPALRRYCGEVVVVCRKPVRT